MKEEQAINKPEQTETLMVGNAHLEERIPIYKPEQSKCPECGGKRFNFRGNIDSGYFTSRCSTCLPPEQEDDTERIKIARSNAVDMGLMPPKRTDREAVARIICANCVLWDECRGSDNEPTYCNGHNYKAADQILSRIHPEVKALEEIINKIESQAINAKRNMAEVYKAHRLLKPKDKQSKNYHEGYSQALQDLINYLQNLKAQLDKDKEVK